MRGPAPVLRWTLAAGPTLPPQGGGTGGMRGTPVLRWTLAAGPTFPPEGAGTLGLVAVMPIPRACYWLE
jgi:hypothetical protein